MKTWYKLQRHIIGHKEQMSLYFRSKKDNSLNSEKTKGNNAE